MANGSVAVVTGAARGIGAATVAGLTDAGWTVVAVDACSDDPRLPYPMATRGELDAVARSSGAQAVVADATDPVVMAAVVADAERRHGGVDAFIAGAGVIAGGVPLWKMPVEQERAVLSTCLDGVLVGARVAIPALLRRPEPRQGRFIAVASAAAIRGLPMLAAYCAAKAGVVGAVRALAMELRGTGVSANAICPGSTRTAILDESARLYGLTGTEAFAAQQPVERLLEPAEVAALLVWLAGPQSSGLTGAAVPVDGGLTV
jgi:SDR family mycofactocin-dependent oxidoreductase